MLKYDYAVNLFTYPEGPTYMGTIACKKRLLERVEAEVEFNMDRLTNLFNSVVGSEVPLTFMYVWSDTDYIVSVSPYGLKQPALIKRLTEESPKLNVRRIMTELGISRNTQVWGKRRIHSTAFICGKGSSLKPELDLMLSGVREREEITKLKNDAENNLKCTNLSKILSSSNFLIGCWNRIRSNKSSLTPAFGKDTLDGIKLDWFEITSTQFRNGTFSFRPSKRIHIPKSNGKLRPPAIPSPEDKIVQEGMRYLLEIIFEPEFKNASHGFRPGLRCATSFNDIRIKFGNVKWFIEGDIEQQFPSIDHHILVDLLKERIDDQAFVDLVFKYLRVGYGEDKYNVASMKIGVSQGGILSPILFNIYMNPFDSWIENVLMPKFNKGLTQKRNPLYTKTIRQEIVMAKTNVRSTLGIDSNFKKMKYIRYADDFLIGIIGSKDDCLTIRKEIKHFLWDNLKLNLNLEKSKITHATKDAVVFLGYKIHLTPLNKVPIKGRADGVLTKRTSRPILDAPVDKIVKNLYLTGYARKDGQPTRNGKFIHHSLADLIKHYRTVEGGILNYYGICNNFGRVSARVHYILKYSCALTIASKMKLKTLSRVFSKYGRNLRIKDEQGKIIMSYPLISYKKRNRVVLPKGCDPKDLIQALTYRIKKGKEYLAGPCRLCGSTKSIEIHHVKALRKGPPKDFLNDMMKKMNKKQIPLCQNCHSKIHKGSSDGR